MFDAQEVPTVDIDVDWMPGARKGGLFFIDRDARHFYVDRVTPDDMRTLANQLVEMAALMEAQATMGGAR